MNPIISQLNIIAESVEKAVEFYRHLGLEIDDSRPFSEHHIAVKSPSGFLLEIDSATFASTWNAGWKRQQGIGRTVIGFGVPARADVDAVYSRILAAGYRGQQPPFDAFWGARYAIVIDPDGNPVGLMSPIDPKMRGAPPAL